MQVSTADSTVLFYDQLQEVLRHTPSNIVPLIAIFSAFSGRRISIYPYANKILQTLPQNVINLSTQIKAMIANHIDDKKLQLSMTQYAQLNELDKFLSKLQMSHAYCAVNLGEDILFKRPPVTESDRKSFFDYLHSKRHIENLEEIERENVKEYVEKIEGNLNDKEQDFIKTKSQLIDYSLSSLLTSHQYICAYDLSFSDKRFGKRSLVLLADDKGISGIGKYQEKWEHLKYRINNVLSCALAFELNLKTYDLFLRSSGFVLKKDPEGWSRINKQVELAKIVEKEIDIVKA